MSKPAIWLANDLEFPKQRQLRRLGLLKAIVLQFQFLCCMLWLNDRQSVVVLKKGCTGGPSGTIHKWKK